MCTPDTYNITPGMETAQTYYDVIDETTKMSKNISVEDVDDDMYVINISIDDDI